ncbi:hypothetical protein GWK08_06860 [Leptobacterium flavescens]|uniref:Uncharacterized protein n=1 Tax=Leptobacterium flavescens TaxID=472055 RepID=A0A6P0UKS9_9FLAO|nr:hypothetical protein [Leptobacterium flavescens]NER13152.1 hypothetical protein [Leptobacterium flavescens]
MKYFLTLALLLNFNCFKAAQNQFQDMQITYNAATRGFYFNVELNSKEIKVSEDRSNNDVKIATITSEQWKEISSLIGNIDVGRMHELKAPSENRNVDGAAFAALSIENYKGLSNEASFDHGNPPPQIKQLIDRILSLAETVE